MKKVLSKCLLQAVAVFMLYYFLLRFMAHSAILSGVFCPGPHLPFYSLPLICLFVLVRIYLIFLPGFLLARIGAALLKRRCVTHISKECINPSGCGV